MALQQFVKCVNALIRCVHLSTHEVKNTYALVVKKTFFSQFPNPPKWNFLRAWQGSLFPWKGRCWIPVNSGLFRFVHNGRCSQGKNNAAWERHPVFIFQLCQGRVTDFRYDSLGAWWQEETRDTAVWQLLWRCPNQSWGQPQLWPHLNWSLMMCPFSLPLSASPVAH